jgi:hypothetical protein
MWQRMTVITRDAEVTAARRDWHRVVLATVVFGFGEHRSWPGGPDAAGLVLIADCDGRVGKPASVPALSPAST